MDLDPKFSNTIVDTRMDTVGVGRIGGLEQERRAMELRGAVEKKYIVLDQMRDNAETDIMAVNEITRGDPGTEGIKKSRYVMDKISVVNVCSAQREVTHKTAVARTESTGLYSREVTNTDGQIQGIEEYTATMLNAEHWSSEHYGEEPMIAYSDDHHGTIFKHSYLHKSPGEYELKLPRSLENVKSVELLSCTVPNTLNTVHEGNNIITVDIIDESITLSDEEIEAGSTQSLEKITPDYLVSEGNDRFYISQNAGVSWHTVTLLHGRYTIAELMVHLVARIYLAVGEDDVLTVTWSSGKFTFTGSGDFHIRVDPDGPYEELGFAASEVYSGSSGDGNYTLESENYSSMHITGVSYFMIRLDPGLYTVATVGEHIESKLNDTVFRESVEAFPRLFNVEYDSVTGIFSISLNRVYTLTSSNNVIGIKEAVADEYTLVTLKTGHYTGSELMTMLAMRLNAVSGLTGEYSVEYSEYTMKFKVLNAVGDFYLDLGEGPAAALGMVDGELVSENFEIESTLATVDRLLKFCLKFWQSGEPAQQKADLWYLLGFQLPYMKNPDETDLYRTTMTNAYNFGEHSDISELDLDGYYHYEVYRRPDLFPNKYIFLTIDGLSSVTDISNPDVTNIEPKNIIAKIELGDELGSTVSKFVSAPVIFLNSSLKRFDILKIKWVDYKGDTVDFGLAEHSFSLRIIQYIDQLDVNAYSTRRGLIDRSSKPESLTLITH